MSKKNFTISTVATAPSPATSGTSLVVASGDGSLFAVNEPAIIFPVNDQPLVANAEIVMVTNVSTDTLTITRTQESTSARTIVAGDIIIQGITAKDWNDLITSVAGKIPNSIKSGNGDSVATVDSADIEGEYLVKFDADGNITDSGLHSGNVLESIDEDNMASNLDTKVPTQQSVKAYVDSKGFVWKGSWTTSTGYAVNDTVESNGSGYVCTSAHTSGATTEPEVGASWTDKWDLFVEGTNKTMPAGDIVGTTDTQTLANKTLTSPVLNTGVSGTAILDEDDMASNSATQLATQQSIKAYVDGEVLYNDTIGTTGNVTISETAANFTYLEIFFKSNDPAYNSCKVFTPNGKSVSLIVIIYSGGAVYHKVKRASISGTTITSNDNSEYYFTNSSTATINTNNNIAIVRVVGYR